VTRNGKAIFRVLLDDAKVESINVLVNWRSLLPPK
jgi:hypothetical protein